jgi:ribonuclease-3
VSQAVTVRDGAPAVGEVSPTPSDGELALGFATEGRDGAGLSGEEREGLERLAQRLQITFRRPALLREAMTHASWNNERGEPSGPGHDNERLEYLGDAVLELVVGEHLFKRFPEYDEGQLTQLRAALVNTISLAKLAERLGLGETLLVGRGAAKTGARQLPSLLANSYEAMIGAIFLDQGYRVATRVFLQSIGDLAEWSDQNHKGKLQEVAQVKLGGTPAYRVTSLGGPGHRREYRAEAMVNGELLGEGRGGTKQAAEQAAARVALDRLERHPAAPRKPSAAEPARVRRRVAELAADRRAASAGRAAPARQPAGSGAGGRGAAVPAEEARGGRRGLLGALRAAASALGVARPKSPAEPPPATGPPPATEPAAGPARRHSRRGHRGGRGRHRPAASAGSTTEVGPEPPSGSAP